MKLNDLLMDGNPYFYSLRKLLGQDIKDIEIYFEKKNNRVLVVATNIILKDNTILGLDADDYVTYLNNYNNNVINFEDDTIDKLYAESQSDDW